MACATIKSYLQCKRAPSMIATFLQKVICNFRNEMKLKMAPKNLQMINI